MDLTTAQSDSLTSRRRNERQLCIENVAVTGLEPVELQRQPESEKGQQQPASVNLFQRMRKYRYLIAASHRITWFLGQNYPDAVPIYFVTGYPKSGTVWACQLLADYLQLPYPRLSVLPIGFPAVVHGHGQVSRSGARGAYVLRDGRDVMVSLYFHLSREIPDGDDVPLTARQSAIFPGLRNKADVRKNLPAFIARQLKHPDSTRGLSWAQHVRRFLEIRPPQFALLKYEEMLADPVNALGMAVQVLSGHDLDERRLRFSIERFSFGKQAGRKPGQENRASFLRKGVAGDWINHFTRESAELFADQCGEALISAGYEQDHSWVEECPT